MSSVASIGVAVGRVFDESLGLFAGDPAWAGRSGAYFCLADHQSGLPIMILAVGTVPVEKGEKYLANCIEKARRLASHHDHLSSWESRDPDKNRWGGAIRSDYIYSLSGLPELGDEAVMLATAFRFHPESLFGLNTVAKISGNPYYDPLMQFLNRED